MKYIIDLETMTVEECKEPAKEPTKEPANEPLTLADLFAEHRGVKEYDGIVAEIQKWFYGSLVKAAWCATSLSYFADKLGIIKQIGGKNENVYQMYINAKMARPIQMVDKADLKDLTITKGDILFFDWGGNGMSHGTPKHVGVAALDCKPGEPLFCIGGNQKDKICTLEYSRDALYAVFRPVYGG